MTRRLHLVSLALLMVGAGAHAADLSVGNVTIVQGGMMNVIVSGNIAGESTIGVTIQLEIVPRAGAVGTVEFSTAPPTDIVQLGDPWPAAGTFSIFDTELTSSTTLNGVVDDNGSYDSLAVTFSGAMASFPVTASADADGEWDILLSTSEGASTWCGLATTLVSGTVTACPSVDPVTTPTDSAGFAKNRFISFTPGSVGETTAIRVVLTDLPTSFEVGEGTVMWAGPTQDVSENGGVVDPASQPTFPSFTAAVLQCTPHYMDWGAVGTVHLYGEEIVPDGAVYTVQAIHQDCDETDELHYSDPVDIITAKWGDVVGMYTCGCPDFDCWDKPDGNVDMVTDLVAMIDKFGNISGAPLKSRTDLEYLILDLIINISDAVLVADAFADEDYPYAPSCSFACQTCPPPPPPPPPPGGGS